MQGALARLIHKAKTLALIALLPNFSAYLVAIATGINPTLQWIGPVNTAQSYHY